MAKRNVCAAVVAVRTWRGRPPRVASTRTNARTGRHVSGGQPSTDVKTVILSIGQRLIKTILDRSPQVTHSVVMPRPMAKETGKVTDLRERLNVYRTDDPERYRIEIDAVKEVYAAQGSIKKTAKRFGIGKRTLERVMTAHPELRKAIDSIRVLSGR